MKTIILLVTLLSYSAFAANIQLNIGSKLTNGNSTKTAKATILAKLGTEWEIPFQNDKNLVLKMKVSKSEEIMPDPKYNSENAFLFEGKIIEKINGTETIIASPKVITLLGKEAIMTIDDSKKQTLELTIHPIKIVP